MPYKLSATLSAHSSDVRAVASPIDTLVLSASRDSTAVSWTRPSPTERFVQSTTFRAGSRFVNAITYIPPTTDAPKGFVVTGGHDTVINIFPLDSEREEPAYSLIGHTENVCALDATASGLIISGSWDRTAKVWQNFQLAYELRGHEQSVWAVLAVDEETFLTGSADKTIKLWNKHKAIQTFTGHTDAVRGLALVPELGFASCSNDSEIRVWTTGGDLIYSLSGHTSFVYSLSVLPNGDIVSGGEDRTVRVWRDGECAQTIVHPAISVWAVSTMPNGDIVSGSSDGVVRVFSAAEERWAPAEQIKEYEEHVANQALPSQQVGDVKKTDLPGQEALAIPGKKAGEVKMIRNGDTVEAHQWDNVTSSWQKIGEVVDAVGSGRKQLYQGKEYDYVFDVDIQDGVPPLKLPYNATENPYTAAQRFLAQNELSNNYIDEVVRFIEKNTAGVNLSSNSNDYVDPFTGASRYQASSNSAAAADGGSASGYSDPFTGGSRYTPQSSSMHNQPEPPPRPVPYNHQLTVIPVRTFLSFKQANVPAMRGKIHQLNDAFQEEVTTSALALYPEELELMDEALTGLTGAIATGTACTLDSKHILTIISVLDRWPTSQRFPVIDLARLISGFCYGSYADPEVGAAFFRGLLVAVEWNAPWETPLPKAKETNVLLTLRAIANALQEVTPSGGYAWLTEILSELSKAPYTSLNKNHRVTLATILFNISCVRLKGHMDSVLSNIHMSLITSVLKEEQSDSETMYRALVGLGNLLYAYKAQGVVLPPSLAAELRQHLSTIPNKLPEERINAVSLDVESLI